MPSGVDLPKNLTFLYIEIKISHTTQNTHCVYHARGQINCMWDKTARGFLPAVQRWCQLGAGAAAAAAWQHCGRGSSGGGSVTATVVAAQQVTMVAAAAVAAALR